MRRLASGDMSSVSGSNIDSIDTVVRKTSMGRAFFGSVFMKSMTCCGTARADLSFFVVSSSSAGFGRRPNHNKWQVSSKVEFPASSWMLYPR